MTLLLTAAPIEPIQLLNPAAGALVSFEGRVRNHNHGREVISLEYEAHTDLAKQEFAKIEIEARERFPILDLRCIHRVGLLQIGDMAVWIGVLAKHRQEAFDACQYLITQLKARVPIWKRELYADGSHGWIEHRCG